MRRAQREAQMLAERWRLAGQVLRRIDPVAFDALLMAAEVVVAETPEESVDINIIDIPA